MDVLFDWHPLIFAINVSYFSHLRHLSICFGTYFWFCQVFIVLGSGECKHRSSLQTIQRGAFSDPKFVISPTATYYPFREACKMNIL